MEPMRATINNMKTKDTMNDYKKGEAQVSSTSGKLLGNQKRGSSS